MFKMTIEFISDKGIIKITTLGVFDIAADMELVSAGISASRQYGSAKFLLDSAKFSVPLVDFFDQPQG